MNTSWNHGYYAEGGYTFGHFLETMPARLHWAALWQGHEVPQAGFRYLDAGCGQGLNLVIAAACHPDSEFVGIDFMPEHIAHARSLAQDCGLTNVSFLEGDFVALSESPAALGEFDFAVCHGISTWVAPLVRQALFKLVSRALKPGGLFYNSYNTLPGWSPMLSFQQLVLLQQRNQSGPQALKAAQQLSAWLLAHSPAMARMLPTLQPKLDQMAGKSTDYLLQEYNNQGWQPMFVSEMIDELASVKLDYLGTATLLETIESSLPTDVRSVLAEQPSAQLREVLRDGLLNQQFRRDLYVKGRKRPWPGRAKELTSALRVQVNDQCVPRPPLSQPFVFSSGILELQGNPTFYHGLMDVLAQHPEGVSVAQLDPLVQVPAGTSLFEALTLLLHGGWVVPQLFPSDASTAACQANRALAKRTLAGAPYRVAVAPHIGQGVTLTEVDWCLVNAHLSNLATDQRAAAIQQGLSGLGKALAQQGKPVTDAQQLQTLLAEKIAQFDAVTLPWLKRLGCL